MGSELVACLGPKTLFQEDAKGLAWELSSLCLSPSWSEVSLGLHLNPLLGCLFPGQAEFMGRHQNHTRMAEASALPASQCSFQTLKPCPSVGQRWLFYLHPPPFLLPQLLTLALRPVVRDTPSTFRDSLGAQPLPIIICMSRWPQGVAQEWAGDPRRFDEAQSCWKSGSPLFAAISKLGEEQRYTCQSVLFDDWI